MEKKNKIFFFSPHFDDAIFSCGGVILNHLKNGDSVSVATVFSKIPEEENFNDFSSQIASKEIFEMRKKENSEILENLNIEVINLDFLDAIFRKDDHGLNTCLSWDDVFKASRNKYEDEKILHRSVIDLIKNLLTDSSSVAYFPLSLGDHIDHVLVNKITEAIEGKIKRLLVYYYEDLPYAYQSLQECSYLNNYLEDRIEEIDIDKKISLVLSYQSSLAIGGDYSLTVESIKKHAYKIGDGSAAYERFWVIKK